MSGQFWVAPVTGLGNGLSGTALASSTSPTDISSAPQRSTAGLQLQVGTQLILVAGGVYSTTTGPPNLTLGFYYGGVAGVALATTGAVATTASATNVPWRIEYHGEVRTTGGTGTIYGAGFCLLGASVSAFQTSPAGILPMPNTAQATVTIDTTIAKAITVGGTWGTSSASNTVTCGYFTCLVV